MAPCDYYYGKTFAHLAAALAVASASAEYSNLGAAIKVADAPMVNLVISFVVLMGTLFGVLRTPPGSPLKYVFFAGFAFWIGQVIKPLVKNLEDNKLLVRVLLLTTGVFVGLMAIGFYDNQNTLGFGPYLLAALVGLILARLAIYVFATPEERAKAENWMALAGVGIFSLYTVYDTQMVKENARMCGSMLRKGRLPDYPAESLGLFLDFVNLFSNLSELSD
jgi:FtsH-binding integral membrane protein